MSKERKSFLLHFDSLGILDQLTNDQCGKLFIACRDYNLGKELNLDETLALVFFPFKAQFQRDKEKYSIVVNRNKTNGSKGGRPANPVKPKKPSGLIDNPSKPKKADSGNVNGSVSGNESDNDSKSDNKDIVTGVPKFNFKKELLALNVDKKVLNDWMDVRKKKRATNSETAFTGLLTEIEKSGLSVADAIKIAAENSWSGFKSQWYSNLSPSQQAKSTHTFETQNYTSGKF